MAFDAASASVWIAAISMIGAALVTIITGIFQMISQKRIVSMQSVADQKLDTIHTLTNSALSIANAKLDTALAVIEQLKIARTAVVQKEDLQAARASTPPHQPEAEVSPSFVKAATIAGVVAATAVADAAVDKKDEIVGKK